jgi:hypothetical protein
MFLQPRVLAFQWAGERRLNQSIVAMTAIITAHAPMTPPAIAPRLVPLPLLLLPRVLAGRPVTEGRLVAGMRVIVAVEI